MTVETPPLSDQTTFPPPPLSKLDIQAMRQADSSVCFNHTGNAPDSRHYLTPASRGVGKIRCHKAVRNPGPFDDRDREYVIPCISTVSDYADYSEDYRPQEYKASSMEHHPQNVHGPWPTVCAFVRPGDMLELHWCAKNNNAHSDRAELYADRMELRIERPSKNGAGCKRYVFILDNSINPGDTARMVQPRCGRPKRQE